MKETTTEMHVDQRWRTALHESAHGCIAIACGADVELLSIRPGQLHAGIAFATYPTWSGDTDAAVATPGPFVPKDLRRVLEMRMAVCLAGERGALMGPPLPSDFRPTAECASEAETLARELADLSPRHVELLLAAEADTEGVLTDTEQAEQASTGMGQGLERAAHVNYMREVTANLVRHLEREIVSVATELYRREVMTGSEVRAAMRAAYPPIGSTP